MSDRRKEKPRSVYLKLHDDALREWQQQNAETLKDLAKLADEEPDVSELPEEKPMLPYDA